MKNSLKEKDVKMDKIINSILDSDLYKFSMQCFALELFPDTVVTYKFKNRGEQRFNEEFATELQHQINSLAELKLTNDEYLYIKNTFPYLTPGYIEYLKNYQFDPSQVVIKLTEDKNLDLEIKGKWVETILFEVPLMAIISELYFKMIDTNWVDEPSTDGPGFPNEKWGLGQWNRKSQRENAFFKIRDMQIEGASFADFGTRRRRSYNNQKTIVKAFVDYQNNYKQAFDEATNLPFVGTSNVYFAMKYGIKAIGTYAHEIPQAMQSLESLNHCNYYAMQNWIKLFKTSLGIALCDTITTEMFLNNFNIRFAKLFDGCRHDSGDPFDFAEKIVDYYKELGINPLHKTIIFSDGLNIDKAIRIKKYCEGKINCSFGIGTFLTNDFLDSPALNMVIKLYSVNNFPVVKLGDGKGKENGDPKAVEIMRWVVKNQLGK